MIEPSMCDGNVAFVSKYSDHLLCLLQKYYCHFYFIVTEFCQINSKLKGKLENSELHEASLYGGRLRGGSSEVQVAGRMLMSE